MSDDLLSVLGRKQREDLEREGEPSSEHDFERPFDADERASILDAVFERVDEVASAPEQPSPRNVVPLRTRRGALAGGLLTLAAAAAVVWWVWPAGEPELIAAVPAYTFTELEGGVAEVRSDSKTATDVALPELRLRPTSKIEWVLTPAEPIRSSVGVALLARSDAGATRFTPSLAVEVSEDGALRVRGRLDEHVELAPGIWAVTLFIAPPEQLPSDADAAADDPSRWRSLSLRVIIVADE